MNDRDAGIDRCQEWTDPEELEVLAQELAVAKRRIAELEAGHAPGCPVAGVAERVSTTWTITCAECGDLLHADPPAASGAPARRLTGEVGPITGL